MRIDKIKLSKISDGLLYIITHYCILKGKPAGSIVKHGITYDCYGGYYAGDQLRLNLKNPYSVNPGEHRFTPAEARKLTLTITY